MYFLYSVLFSLGFIALAPRFLLDALRRGKYAAGFRQRLGALPAIEANGRPLIWLHCVSVGETQAARPLVRAILDKYPTHALVVSTTTLTGQRVAREAFGQAACAVFYFPFDWRWSVRRALTKVQPSAVLIMETELWPRFLRECDKKNIPVAIINGRLSDRSFRRYKIISRFIRRVVNDLDLALMQTRADAERIQHLGLQPERVKVSGNVKFDAGAPSPDEQKLTGEFRARFSFCDGRPLIVAASTHAPEEHILIEAFRTLRGTASIFANARLVIVPRHPERFAETASLLASSGFNWTRRSDRPNATDRDCDVLLLDTVGELRVVYPLADIVFVGGSLAPAGGHNILEPAAAGACVITGPHTHNFTEIVRAFLDADALIQLPSLPDQDAPPALAIAFKELLEDDARRATVKRHAHATLEQNRGATDLTVEMLAIVLAPSSQDAKAVQLQSAQTRALQI